MSPELCRLAGVPPWWVRLLLRSTLLRCAPGTLELECSLRRQECATCQRHAREVLHKIGSCGPGSVRQVSCAGMLWMLSKQLRYSSVALFKSAEEASLRLQLVPPEVKDTPEAPKQARKALQKMGPMSRDQIIMSATMAGAVVLWVLGDQLQIPAVTAAMLGLCSLLLTGVLKWRDCLEYSAVRICSCSRPRLTGSDSFRITKMLCTCLTHIGCILAVSLRQYVY